MRLPVVAGLIDRRILANYRCDPAALARLLPAPFRPKRVGAFGVAGICLIRLRSVRPRFVPRFAGLSSENAAHRIAVEWDEGGTRREGVYIPRRDTSSRINVLLGSRLFPGVHHHAAFEVDESGDRLQFSMQSDDGATNISLDAARADALPRTSVFSSLDEASAFFEAGAVGYSPSSRPGGMDGLELRTREWQVEPLRVERIASSFFDDPLRFPPGAAKFDCALLMRHVAHEWHGLPAMGAGSS